MSFESIDEKENNNLTPLIFNNGTFSGKTFKDKIININSPNNKSNRESNIGDVSTEMSGKVGILKTENNKTSINCSEISPFYKNNKSLDIKNNISENESIFNIINKKYYVENLEEVNIEIPILNRLKTNYKQDQKLLNKNYIFTFDDNDFLPSKDSSLFEYEQDESEVLHNLHLLFHESKKIHNKIDKKIKVLFRKIASSNYNKM